jgi:hypothetical protein
MSDDQVRQLVATEGFLVLGTLDGAGPPLASIAPCRPDEAGLTFAVPVDSREAQNLRRDPRACAVIENAERDFYRIRCATVHGSAVRMFVDPDSQLEFYRLPLDDVVSFDFSRIQRRH